MTDSSRRFRMRLLPQSFSEFECVDIEVFPPSNLIADLMQLSVMSAAKWDGEFIANLETDRPLLRKAQVMRIGGLPAADQTGL